MKFVDLARLVLPVMAALASHTASAQFTVVLRTGQLEARPGVVMDLPGKLDDPTSPWDFHQGSSDGDCMPPRCTENFFQDVSAISSIEANRLVVATNIYASMEPVDLVNKGEVSITFDVAQRTDVLLVVSHGYWPEGVDSAPMSSSYSFGRLLDDGSFEAVVLPTLGGESGYTEKQLNLTLQSGRYVMTSRIAFNSSLSFPPGGVTAGGFVGEGGGIRITQVPELGTLALACAGGLAMGLVVGASRRKAARAPGR